MKTVPWLLCDLPVVDYREALRLQRALVEAKIKRRIEEDVLLMLEHPAVFTLGRRGGRENLTVSESFLKERGILVVPVERGGNITYHGPGQLVAYPIVCLAPLKLSVTDFVDRLEEVMLRVCGSFGIAAARDSRNRGIWVGDRKMGSIGIHIRRGIAFHGLALNVETDLTPFTWIHPCGLTGVTATSMEKEAGRAISMAEVRKEAARQFAGVFGVGLESVERAALSERAC